MKCTACGADVPTGAAFCQNCGQRMNEEAGKPPVDPAADAGQPVAATKAGRTKAERLREAAGSSEYNEAEELLWEGGYSGKAMFGSWIGIAIVSLALLIGALVLQAEPTVWWVVAGAIVLLWLFVLLLFASRKLSVDYRLTTQRFIHRSGLLTRRTDRIEVIDIDDVTFEQGIVQRMLGVGSVRIDSSDRSHPELWLYGIDDVQRVAGMIDDVRRAERRRRGLHIEAI